MDALNKSDISVAVTIKDLTGHIIDYLSLNWSIEFYVLSDKRFVASCTDGQLSSNCEIVTEVNSDSNPIILSNGDTLRKVIIYIDSFDFGSSGAVYQETTVFFPNNRFADGNQKATDKRTINLVIK